MMRAAWGLGVGQGASEAPVSVRILAGADNADRHPKDCGPKGCAENSPTPALLLSCDAQRHRALVAPWRRTVLSATRIMLFPGQHTSVAVRFSGRLHEDQELIFRSETLPFEANFHR